MGFTRASIYRFLESFAFLDDAIRGPEYGNMRAVYTGIYSTHYVS